MRKIKRKIGRRWSAEDIRSIIENFAMSTGHSIIQCTQKIDKYFSPTDLSRWMDSVKGPHHRVIHGHDFLANVGKVYEKFGVEGVIRYPFELMKDAITPHGIPVPGTEFLVKGKIVRPGFATEWLSLNVADVFTGGVAFYSTYKLYKKGKNGEIDKSSVCWATIGVGVKIVSGVATHNPILIASGCTDVGILMCNLEQAKEAFKKYLDFDISVTVTSKATAAGIAAGIATGIGASTATTGVVGTLCTASTGTAISALSGVAAKSATLAAIGGGSLASGGLGMLGGMIILSAGSTGLGGIAAFATYRMIKKYRKKKTAEQDRKNSFKS